MSKELEALKRIYDLIIQRATPEQSAYVYTGDYKLIETALKDYEKKTKLAKEYADVNNVAKRLKAFEIIKEKRVDVCYFMNCRTLEEYNDDVLGSYAYEEDNAKQRILTQEEYDLLKEVLL